MTHRPMNLSGNAFEALAQHIDRLLDDNTGCPWDREQTLSALAAMLHEESDELAEAIDEKDPDHALDEAGDMFLLMFLILAKLRDTYHVDINDAARKSVAKIVRRHTWIFGDDAGKVRTPEDAERLWAENKKKE